VCSSDLEGPPLTPPFYRSITTQLALKGVAATDWFSYAACGGYLSSSESFHLNVTKRFGHDIHGLILDGLKPANTEKVTICYGEDEPQDQEEVTTDNMGAFDIHVPYQAEAITVKAIKGQMVGGSGHPLLRQCCEGENVEIPTRQRRMTFCGIAAGEADSLKYNPATGALICR
jgi:hypothetical protein